MGLAGFGLVDGTTPCRPPDPDADPLPVSRLPFAEPPSASTGLLPPTDGPEVTPVAPVDASADFCPPLFVGEPVPALASRTAVPLVVSPFPAPVLPVLLAEAEPLDVAPGVVLKPEPD